MTTGVPTTPLVELRGISKRYGELLANDGIDLAIGRGEILALLGENGAGKSTLVKILYGVVEPSAGEILWEGRPVAITSPVEARRLGIGMVFQHFSLFDELTVAENIAVALSDEWSLGQVRGRIGEVSRAYGLELEPDRAVWTLSAGERQRIEIVRCLLQSPKLLILDEPTSVLTPQEAEHLFVTLDKLAAEGCAILYISHKLEEVRRLCGRATILRGGRVVATANPRDRSAREIAAMMVGSEVGEVRAIAPHHRPERSAAGHRPVPPACEPPRQGAVRPQPDCRGGRSGRHRRSGWQRPERTLRGALGRAPCRRRGGHRDRRPALRAAGIEARRRLGAAFVPEERLGHAAAPSHRLSENTLVSHHSAGEVSRSGFISLDTAKRLRAFASSRAFDVRKPEPDPAGPEALGRQPAEIRHRSRDDPQSPAARRRPADLGRGCGRRRPIRQALVDLAGEGSAVLVISQDLDELFEIADRMAVIHDGHLSPLRPTQEWTREAIGLE